MGINPFTFNPTYFDPQQDPELASVVRAQTQKIQLSRLFAHSPRLKDFLQFAVGQVLTGESHRLKEYTIAVDVFDRPESFDCRLDSIVRVEARRLREKLGRYYLTEGSADDLLIQFSRGTYVPRFRYRHQQGKNGVSLEKKRVGIIEASPKLSLELKTSLQNLGYDSMLLPFAAKAAEPNPDLDLIAICTDSRIFLENIQKFATFFSIHKTPIIVILSEAALQESVSYLSEAPFQWVLTPIRSQELEATIQIAMHKGYPWERSQAPEEERWNPSGANYGNQKSQKALTARSKVS